VGRIHERLQTAGVTFETEADVSIADTLIRTDGTAVEQILFNLADNAAKYVTGEERRARLRARADADMFFFEFSDNGPGIAPSALKRLFQPFNRSSEDAAGKKPGVGLGLAFSRQLARSLGGDLKLLHSGPDGCAFSLSLPRVGE
jgi:signal transduction histidine kinase